MSSGPEILVFGATSAMCHALLKLYAKQGARFYLLARNPDSLAAVADDLIARGGQVLGSASYDFSESGRHAEEVIAAGISLKNVDIAIVAHGTLPEQEETESSGELVKVCMDDNFVSTAVILQACAQQLSAQENGTLAAISSVAGDRGRKSNYTYGAAKAGVDAFLQGLRGRFSGTAIKVVNIKPGMVSSPMTAGLE